MAELRNVIHQKKRCRGVCSCRFVRRIGVYGGGLWAMQHRCTTALAGLAAVADKYVAIVAVAPVAPVAAVAATAAAAAAAAAVVVTSE